MSSTQSTLPRPADIITLRYEKDMVYVPTAENYQEAISQAQDVYPELAIVDRGNINFMLTVTVRGESHKVRIGPSAWKALRLRVTQYEIIDVHQSDKPLYRNHCVLEPPPVYSPKKSFWKKIFKIFRLF